MLRWIRSALLMVALVALAIAWFMPRESQTLPLFARKYKMECVQCHIAFPRLNKFGMEFRQRGYRLEGADGTSPWEEDAFPLSLIGNVGFDYTSTNAADSTGVRTTFATSRFRQNAVEFHSAGTLAKRVSFRFDNAFTSDAGFLQSGQAWAQFDDLARAGGLNLKAGVFDAEIPYIASSRITTQTDYLMPATLDGEGIELNGRQSGWWYATGLVNSSRVVGKPDDKTLNNLENGYAWLMREVGPHYVTARVFYDQQDPRAPDKHSSPVTQFDASAMVNVPHVTVIPAFSYQKISDPVANDKNEFGMVEALWLLDPNGWWALTGRFEIEHMPKSGVSPEQDLNVEVINLSHFLNRNVRLGAEWAHFGDNVQGPRINEYQLYTQVGY
ncbi:MAG TPA: hypothetical protein VL123_02600 [Candidatus Udaeobacter sp.]|nr:hypothetical protein [Candidatus Udaeobacter sp.]